MAWQSNTIDPASTSPAADISKIKNDLGVLKTILEGGSDAGVAYDPDVGAQIAAAIEATYFLEHVTKNSAYTFALTDRGKRFVHNDTTAYTWTIPLNSAVAFPIGTMLNLRNLTGTGVITIAKTAGVVLRKPGASTDLTTVSLAVWGDAVLVKEDTNTWMITGTGI